MEDKIKLGVSACLLGEEVRYDGGHKRDRFITDTLANYVAFVPVCPEMEAGFGVPRESMHLRGNPDAPRLVTTKSNRDVTAQMLKWAKTRVRELEAENICGFIFKARSPSSGMEEEEGRLHDTKLRENFIESIFVLKRWRTCLDEGKTRGRLVKFHTQHKLLIMAHSVQHYRTMGKLVAEGKGLSLKVLFDEYQEILMAALRLKTTVKKNVNVLQHLMGYFKKDLTGDEKQELLEIFGHYRKGHVPLIVPVTLINHFVRKYDQPYLKEQYYLHPHPVELQLRNHV
jgi:uncharacterized protein YbgA (DUF1722 family)